MDATLRRYLEGPPPRPAFLDSDHDERRVLWLFPLGAAVTFALVLGGIFESRREAWPIAAVIWLVLVFLAALLGRRFYATTQALFRTGTFTNAHVVSTQVEIESEGQTLLVLFRVELAGGADDYRKASDRDAVFHAHLTDRWIVQPTLAPFTKDATFPVLVSSDRKQAKVFVNEEAIDVTRAE